MKNIIIGIFLLVSLGVKAQYNPNLHNPTNKALGVAQNAPTDARSKYYSTTAFGYRFYKNTAEALNYLSVVKYRGGQFPILVNVGGALNADSLTFTGGKLVEYWFRDGLADSNLVAKSFDATSIVKYSDSLVKYVTPSQLKDSLRARANGSDTFTHNIHIYTPLGWGKYPQNSDIPAIGKRIQQVLDDVFTVTIPPTYDPPLAYITASPTGGNYEIGTTLTITLSSTFNQRDGGSLIATSYYLNGSPVSGNTVVLSNITTNQSVYVNKSFAQGACKTNNLGVIDCTGRINAGTVNSGTISYNVFPTYYYGFIPNNSPTDAQARAAGNSFLSTSRTLSGGLPAPSTSSYIVFAYPASFGAANITVGGLGVTFDLTQRVLVNASGNSQLYNIYISPNPTSGAVPTFTVN